MAEPWRIQPGSDRNLITMPGGSLLVLTTNGVCSDRLSFHTAGPLLRGQEKEEGGSFNDAGAAVVVISDTQQGMESIAVYLDCAAVADCTEAAPLAVVTVRIGAPPSATPPGMPPVADPDLPAVPASWRVAATADNGTVLDLLVNEIGCASGRPADGRIRTSAEYRADAVVVTVLVKPRSGAQSCPGNPDTRYTLRLDEPIGSRVLLDGGQSPPAPPPPASSD
jgi:hypothetical protein